MDGFLDLKGGPMYEMIAFCGLDCSECPAYKATQSGDMEELARVAEEWSQQFKRDIPTDSILCDGCKLDAGRLSGYCSTCEVRNCAIAKDVITCAHCRDYVCAKLESHPAFQVEGKVTLDRIKEGL
jgi:Protein of unknown function (DUF3795)